MQKIIKEMTDGIVQITIADERWYVKEVMSSLNCLRENT